MTDVNWPNTLLMGSTNSKRRTATRTMERRIGFLYLTNFNMQSLDYLPFLLNRAQSVGSMLIILNGNINVVELHGNIKQCRVQELCSTELWGEPSLCLLTMNSDLGVLADVLLDSIVINLRHQRASNHGIIFVSLAVFSQSTSQQAT